MTTSLLPTDSNLEKFNFQYGSQNRDPFSEKKVGEEISCKILLHFYTKSKNQFVFHERVGAFANKIFKLILI